MTRTFSCTWVHPDCTDQPPELSIGGCSSPLSPGYLVQVYGTDGAGTMLVADGDAANQVEPLLPCIGKEFPLIAGYISRRTWEALSPPGGGIAEGPLPLGA